jgi:PQQ-dependent catabolism-associated CXXCW motif protein
MDMISSRKLGRTSMQPHSGNDRARFLTVQSAKMVAVALLTCTLVQVSTGFAAFSASYKEIRERRPELFHPATGFRIDRQRAPVPDDVPPPVRVADTQDVANLSSSGAVLLDVYAAFNSRFDELDGRWLVSKPHRSIPGAVWLPETGRGVLEPQMSDYLETNLGELTGGNPSTSIVVFCVSDCWMSWNASQRIAGLGYANVYWYPPGVDGWEEAGHDLEIVEPVPLKIE